MNYKHNCTKGPATYKKREVGIFCDVYSTDPGEGGFPSIARTEDEANAELIAEAFSVLHHRGYTPLELVEHKGILIAALKDLMESFVCKCSDSENPEWTPSYDKADNLIRDIEQGNDLSKYAAILKASSE